jgi:hypothetical protein
MDWRRDGRRGVISIVIVVSIAVSRRVGPRRWGGFMRGTGMRSGCRNRVWTTNGGSRMLRVARMWLFHRRILDIRRNGFIISRRLDGGRWAGIQVQVFHRILLLVVLRGPCLRFKQMPSKGSLNVLLFCLETGI